MSNVELMQVAGAAVAALLPGRELFGFEPLGSGHINDTLLVTFAAGTPRQAVLQRLNRAVFPEPEKIMANLVVLADHLAARLALEPPGGADPRVVVRPLGGVAGQPYFRDPGGDFWRLITYVGDAENKERLDTPEVAREAGRGLGVFHRLVADLEPSRLADTLPGFHVAPAYLAAYDRLLAAGRVGAGLPGETNCHAIIEAHRELAGVLEEAVGRGVLHPRVIHGDPRLANLLFDRVSGRAVALVDLDTVKPGLLHYDLGDCLRSCCNPAGDDPEDLAAVRFDLEIGRHLLTGYLAEAGATLSDSDYQFVYPALRLLAFELGLRFFSDHLAGDRYFRVARPGQNLHRALGQFRLLAEIEAQEEQIQSLIAEVRVTLAVRCRR
ncbi:MAG TPA: aminoglycoside phosphotransferase family protein [Desulfurivibrionaceae bacterium]|nr:aminoglycoside phosphotransferase family protein [Desulfurivibrionaceae bacterium]